VARNLQKIYSSTPDLDRVQDQVDSALRTLNNHPLLRGTQVTVNLVAGAKSRVSHGLGRAWLGWFPVDQRQQGQLWAVDADTQRERYLTLSGSLGGQVSLFIY
jgi:hypothetical protein